MSYLINKPIPPIGYRMLVEGEDISSVQDLIWIISEKSKSKQCGNLSQRWAHSIMQTDKGLKISYGVNRTYTEPRNVEDYCFYRCRKI
jgi:hypothetical protein